MSHWLNVAGRTGMPCDPRLWTATREVEVLNEAPGPATCAELWRLAAEARLRPVRALTGTIWEAT